MIEGRTVEVVPARVEHVPAMVAAHLTAFPGFFLTMLGQRFLSRMYAALVSSDEALAFVAIADGGVSGFVAGPLKPIGYFRRLFLRQGMAFAIDALPALLVRPAFVARRLLRAVRYRGEAPEGLEGAALLSSIAVVPDRAGSGTASALLEAFCGAAAAAGASGVYLLTDRDANERANRFYGKHGFTCLCEMTRSDARVMNLFWRATTAAVPGKPADE